MQEHKLNVMHVLRDLGVGGIQEVVRTLVEYLAMDNCRPIVCTLEDGHLRQDIESLGVRVEFLEKRRYKFVYLPWSVPELLRTRKRLADLVKKYDIEVVQTHSLWPISFLLLSLLPTTNLRVLLWTFHSMEYAHYKTRLMRQLHNFMYRLFSRRVSGYVAVSDRVREVMLEQIGPIEDRIFVIYNGVDLRRYEIPVDRMAVRRQLGLRADARVFATVGTLRAEKGHRFLIDAAAMIVPQHPDLHFLLIGDGKLRAELQVQVESLNLHSNIHFLGNRSDVAELLISSDFFILPSICEGMPMALLEAMAAGKPIIATTVSGVEQVMIPNETGLIVPPGDTLKLADAILELISDPARAQAMGLAARQRVAKEFSAQKQADDHLALYRQLIQRSSGHVG